MSNITNLNRDYLIKINVKEATIDVPKMTFWNTDKKTSNMFVQLVINMSENKLIENYVTIENATDYKITLNVIKPKTNQYRTFEATLLNEEKALFEIDLTSEFIDQVGNYNFEFEVSSKVDNNDESITTSSSTYEVKGSILTNLNEETSSSPDLPILKQLIEQVKSLQGGDLTGYQKKSDNSLETTSKEVVGAINEVNSQCKDIEKQIESGNIGNNVEPLDDDLPNIYITGTLPTSKGQGDLPITIHYISKTLDFKNYGTLKVQGASSAGYPKKNFTLKLYEDKALTTETKRVFKNWGKLNKFVLKAHWMDCSHIRNVGTAKIWGKIAKSRSDYDTLPEEFKKSPNAGATDGFTVKVFANGIYQGLYEWIVPKDKLFGQDSKNPKHSILNSELNNQASCAFATTTPAINGNWSEELQDTLSSATSTTFSNFIKFVAGSSDADFIANAENYFDVQSVIDYDIFARIFCIIDNLCRNQIFFTYDGIKWFEGVWDLDAVLGLPPTTRGFYAYNTEFQSGYVAYADYKVTNMLYQRVETLFMSRFKARYNELRADILSIEGILHVYEKLTNVIKTYDGLLEEDYASTTGEGKFTGIPYQKENNIQQIRTFLSKRLIYMDDIINKMAQPVPCTSISLNETTLTFTSKNTQTLTATLIPTDTTDIVTWSVAPIGICTVDNGVVTPIKNGSCVITATCGTKSATCNVSISGLSESDSTEYNYLQGDGKAYIDTGYKPNNNTKIEIKIDAIPWDTAVYGSGQYFCMSGASGVLWNYPENNVETAKNNFAVSNKSGIFIIDKGACYYNGELGYTFTYSEWQSTYNLGLFCQIRDTIIDIAGVKIYYCKIWDGDTLVRDFIPTVDSNKVACLYDKVESKYYYNANTTGSFIIA